MPCLRGASLRRFAKFIADVRTPLSSTRADWERKNFWLRLAGIKIAARGVAVGSGFRCIDGLEENITIEAYAAIGHNVHFWNFDTMHIGRFAMIAADVVATNGWHDKRNLEPGSGALSFGRGCWVGAAARIIGGVSIGDNAIVGAGAVVVHDVPAASIVTGVPGRVIGTRELPERVWHLDGVYFSPHTFELVEPTYGT
jgi:acetyltransferase-like isoleucine patch superfamily enzyme